MNSGQFINPGSAYYFKGWNPETKEKLQQASEPKTMPKENWKDWSKFSQFEQERPSSVGSGSYSEDLSLACNVGEAREMQRKKAQEIATACSLGRKNKAAIMFQKRFERSEKFAIVREPIPNPVAPPTESIVINTQTCEKEGEDQEDEKVLEENVQEEDSQAEMPIHPELPPQLSFLNRQVPENRFISCPKPWYFQPEPPVPEPKHRDFNRTPKGFGGTYYSPYGTYVLDCQHETSDL